MKNTVSDTTAEALAERIDYLSGFMLPERVERIGRTLALRTRYMTVCTENMFHPQNASALVRHCDAFGIQDMYTVEALCKFRPNVNIVKGTDKWITIHRRPTTTEAVSAMKEAGYRIVATSPHEGDATPETFDVEAGRFALVFGTEHAGISNDVMSAADHFIRIPMWGFVDSLNVSASAAIMIYMLSSKVRNSGVDWRLADREMQPILFDWMKRSVRDSKGILAKANFKYTLEDGNPEK